ncbi:MAG: NYN domain-containing protein [Acetobacteraceae bacterium]|nr:NYN domain-containing protein [Acetobacteraceae bacterium]
MSRVAVFVDGANMFYAQKQLGWNLDFFRLLDYFSRGHELVAAFYYTGELNPDPQHEAFLRALTHHGYTVRKRPVREILDQQTGKTVRKANLDVEIAIDMLLTQDQYDVAYLFSGDGDLERVVRELRSRGKRVYVIAKSGMLAFELLNVSDLPRQYLDDLKAQLERTERRPAAQAGTGAPAGA